MPRRLLIVSGQGDLMEWFDSHTHLTDERLVGEADAVVARAREAGVATMVTIGTEPETNRAAAALAARLPGVYAAVGIHPHAAARASEEALAELRTLAAEPRVVAIGETGLDFHYDHAPRDVQRRVFLAHLEIGRELGLPIVVHSREADAELEAVLRGAGQGTRGVLHCFSGGRALMEAALEIGWYVSFAGMVTFKRFDGEALLRAVPADRILVETDAPYLAPVPMRGKRNEPAFVPHVGLRAAAIRGVPAAEFAAQTTRNARELFRLGSGDAS
jgi:TatD DNase family protein